MVEISRVTETDRPEWEALARAHNGHFGAEHTDDVYDRTWRRLLDDDRLRGIIARLDGRPVAVANYLFHASVWYRGKCYLADLYVVPEVRRQGIATTVIEWVARDAEQQGYPSLYWHTLDDSPARALYDKVARHRKGLIHYGYRRDLRA